jgi:O-antigen/teichoic acid export membrane protein
MNRYLGTLTKYFNEASWIIFGQIFGIVITLVSLKILTGIISPLEYGKLTISLTVISMANQLFYGPLNNGIIRFLPVAIEKNDSRFYFKVVNNLFLKATYFLAFIAVIFCVVLFFSNISQYYFSLFLCFLLSVIYGADSLLNGILNILRLRKEASLFNLLSIFLKSIFAIIFIIFISPLTNIVLAGYLIATVIVIVGQFFFTNTVKQKYDNNYNDGENKWDSKIINYSYPFVIWGIFTWLQSSSDKWALSFFDSYTSVGLYSTVLQLGNGPVSLLSGFLLQFFTPIFFSKAGDAQDKYRNLEVFKINGRIIIFTLITTLLLFFLTLFSHNFIFLLFVSSKYSSVSYLLPFVLLNSGLFAVGQNISMNFMSTNNTSSLLYIKIYTSILGIIFNIVGVYFFKLNGLVAAGFLFSLLYCVVLTVYSKKIQNENKKE